jgi:hypothetical protein
VNITDSSIPNDAQGLEARPLSWKHFSVDRRGQRYWRVTFNHPPINTITATTVAELAELVSLIERDKELNVVIFGSANPDFYLAHYDTEHDPSRTAALAVGPTGMHAWLDVLVRLSQAPVVSIASIRGRAHRRKTGAVRPRSDRPHEILCRQCDAAAQQRVSACSSRFL